MHKQVKPIATRSEPPQERPRITYAKFLKSDGGSGHVEWVNGEVVTMAPVSNEHSALQVFLLKILGSFADAFQLGEIRSEPFQMKTGPDLPGRAPDIFFVARRNISRLKTGNLEGPADLVVEIISPGTRSIDRGEKYFEYEKGGVKEYWLIDPIRKQAEFYLLGRDGVYHLGTVEEGIFRSVVLKGLWLKVGWLWRKPLPSVLTIQKEWKLI